ncbi:MAG TPA: recombinase family protein, partial [Arthrobacter sp.]|nr:recombinase family protein [Arthrobacter sp.]
HLRSGCQHADRGAHLGRCGSEGIFTDERSGAREAKERPGMKGLMDYAREDDDVYFWRLDGIGRSAIDVLNTVNDFTSRGVRLHSIMQMRQGLQSRL